MNLSKIIASLNTTTQLLGLSLLLSNSILSYIAVNSEGNIQIVLIVLIGIISLVVLFIAAYLERLRLLKEESSEFCSSSSKKNDRKDITSVSRVHQDYDLFIAAPMASYRNDRNRIEQREDILKIKGAFTSYCGFTKVFYAGENITTQHEFDEGFRALRKNFKILRRSHRFVMIFPEKLPSSTLVETGMALALGKKNVWFVRQGVDLPYILRRGGGASEKDDLPMIQIYDYRDTQDIIGQISRYGPQLFE